MTIIAFDGKTIVADKATSSNASQLLSTKITLPFNLAPEPAERLGLNTTDNFIYAGSGNATVCYAVPMWMTKPKFKLIDINVENKLSVVGLLLNIDSGLIYYITGSLLAEEIIDDVVAIGSCKDVALGVMWSGQSAEKAVQICINRCNGVGLGYDAYTLTDIAVNMRKRHIDDRDEEHNEFFKSVNGKSFG